MGILALSAEIVSLCAYRAQSQSELTIDLRTAIDVAIRDLREIRAHWGTELALDRLSECDEMLRNVLADSKLSQAADLVLL